MPPAMSPAQDALGVPPSEVEAAWTPDTPPPETGPPEPSLRRRQRLPAGPRGLPGALKAVTSSHLPTLSLQGTETSPDRETDLPDLASLVLII